MSRITTEPNQKKKGQREGGRKGEKESYMMSGNIQNPLKVKGWYLQGPRSSHTVLSVPWVSRAYRGSTLAVL